MIKLKRQIKAAKKQSKEYVKIKSQALITPEGKRMQSSNSQWLKEQQEIRGGFILDKGSYKESDLNNVVSINKLIADKKAVVSLGFLP